ncbi:succinyl-diaminopimelate desuccinylase [Sphingomicrobium lutaoense]|uniref:Succinyl-diaminopimelate desuccinylase n=1 Tax=Sphingomicrobium lutaoense TaxID=515949 RepID=A0A839YZM7_9SPHN|nr:succinyl-diaminopimelate desuccinylase [Sphingomicrobium lutaoense]
MALDPVDLTSRLIACPSITPHEAGTLTLMTEWLEPMGFECHHLVSGERPDGPVENLIAIRKGAGNGPHLAFAGHVDVVPPGEGWDGDPFVPRIEDGQLIGRGATDMKGALGAFVAALDGWQQDKGTLSLLITGDEEGPAVHGTRAIVDWLEERSIGLDYCLIGEPSSQERLGDTVKNGRRGSVNVWLTLEGHQGHVAYPQLADNPLPKMARLVAALDAMELDEGTDMFQPSNLEFTAIGGGDGTTNVIPGKASAQFNIRFNDLQKGEDLVRRIEEMAEEIAPGTKVLAKISGEAFLTPEGKLTETLADAIEQEVGIRPRLSTGGGTSDGRFLHKLCPVAEFGLPNATMHKVGERAAVADIEKLSMIYRRCLEIFFA